MRERTPLVVAAAVVVALVIGLVGTVLLGWAWSSIARYQTAGPVGQAAGVDAMFIEQMVPHHQDAIDMAQLALTRAEHEEIRELARSIRQSQSAENRRMRQWYRAWFGTNVPDTGGWGMRGPMMGGRVDLDRLRYAQDFDEEFIEQMVPHHQMAIMMAQMMGRSSRRPEMRELADDIIETQSREIAEMQRWYDQWYGRR